MSNNVAPIIEELRRAYMELKPTFDAVFGEKWVKDPLTGQYQEAKKRMVNMPMPVITVQARGRKHVDGWYKPSAWESDASQALNVLAGQSKGIIASTDEICIAAEALKKSPTELLVILTHQMVHHYGRHLNNNPEYTQNKNGYHNNNFKSFAKRIGLEVDQDGPRGFAITSVPKPNSYNYPNQLTKTFDAINLDKNVFDMARIGEGERVFKGSKLKKWSCKCTNIRAAVYIEAKCSMCNSEFEYTDKDAEDSEVQDWLVREEKTATRTALYRNDQMRRRPLGGY